MTWIANLSNGETIVEQAPVAGEKTAWQKLLTRCRTEGLKITGLRLHVGEAMVEALPPKACDGYFHAYEALKAMFNGGSALKQGIGSVVGELVFITWIDFNQDHNRVNYIHQDMRQLTEVKIHTTID